MTALATDNNGDAVQCLRPGLTQKITSTGTASNAAPTGPGITVVRISPSAAINVSFDGAATSSSLPLSNAEYFRVNPGQVISVIGVATVHITEML